MNYSSNDKCGYKGKKKKSDRERERGSTNKNENRLVQGANYYYYQLSSILL
jgi:hypothetical protein